MSDVLPEPDAAESPRPGIIVLSSSFHIVFLDREAEALLSGLGRNPRAEPSSTLPSPLLDLARELASARSAHQGTNLSDFGRIVRVIESGPHRIQVRGLAIAPSGDAGERVLLVLSPAERERQTTFNGSVPAHRE